jgi:hypothetical protein
MAEYRIYYFGPDNHILRAEELERADDAVAKTIARSSAYRYPVELWGKDRCIGRFEPLAAATKTAWTILQP